MLRDEYDVLIIGAGVGGAALALGLSRALAKTRRRDLRLLLVDRRAGPGNINRGDSLLPAVTAHLRRWDALDAIERAGAHPVRKMQVFHHRDGLLFEAPLATPEGPYLVLPHPEIERALVDTARFSGQVEVRYRCRLVRLVSDGDAAGGRVTGAVLSDEAGGERVVRAALIIGADGASSTVRAGLGIELPTAPYDHGYFIVDVERPAGYEDAMRIELHPDGGVLVVPQAGDRVGLGVLVHQRQDDLFRAGRLQDKLAAIGRRSPLLVGLRAVDTKKGGAAHLYALSRGHAQRYCCRGAALLGDAVHVTNPTAGQGMTMAIEDAEALARWVAPVLACSGAGTGGDGLLPALDRALRSYQGERRPRNDALIRWSHWISRFYATDAPLGDELRRALCQAGATLPGRLVQRWLWSRMATRGGR